jgi:putative protease
MHGLVPELVVGVRNSAAISVCKDYANAAYFSVDRFSLRAKARDITIDTLDNFVEYVTDCGLKSYLAVNTITSIVAV